MPILCTVVHVDCPVVESQGDLVGVMEVVLGGAWEGRAWEEREVGLEELCFSKLKAFMEGFSPLHRILISVPLKTGIERCNPIWWSCSLAWGKGTKLFSARRHRW